MKIRWVRERVVKGEAVVERPANGDTQRRWEKVQGRKLDRRKELQSGVWVCLTE